MGMGAGSLGQVRIGLEMVSPGRVWWGWMVAKALELQSGLHSGDLDKRSLSLSLSYLLCRMGVRITLCVLYGLNESACLSP